jgi:phenylpropionate dioxygenase-like ring-hydroxylating dioxygenase large terminal subunit
VALSDWCPHRGARLSLGVCEFEGTVTCPYHGYVFDGTGQCVAGLIERPDSPFIGKLRARVYPTEERMGIAFVWMGETEPVPLDEDLPADLCDPELTGGATCASRCGKRTGPSRWPRASTSTEFYLHRGVNVWRLFSYRLGFFRPRSPTPAA